MAIHGSLGLIFFHHHCLHHGSNRVISSPKRSLARFQCVLHTAANLLSEIQRGSWQHTNNPAICPLCPQYGFPLTPLAFLLSLLPPAPAAHSPAVPTHRPPSSSMSLRLEYPSHSYPWTRSWQMATCSAESAQTVPLGSVSAAVSPSRVCPCAHAVPLPTLDCST